jgi:hypothetical protein
MINTQVSKKANTDIVSVNDYLGQMNKQNFMLVNPIAIRLKFQEYTKQNKMKAMG